MGNDSDWTSTNYTTKRIFSLAGAWQLNNRTVNEMLVGYSVHPISISSVLFLCVWYIMYFVLNISYILQSCLCYCVELCLESITSLSNLIQLAPTEIELSFSPLPEEVLPPIITCKDFSIGEKAQKLLIVCTPFFFITCSVTSYFFVVM